MDALQQKAQLFPLHVGWVIDGLVRWCRGGNERKPRLAVRRRVGPTWHDGMVGGELSRHAVTVGYGECQADEECCRGGNEEPCRG